MGDRAEVMLGQNVRRLRQREGLTVVELARRAGTSRATLTQLESGAGNPTLETLYVLANALNASLSELIAPPAPPEPPRVVPAGRGARVRGAAVEAWLLDTINSQGVTTEIYDFRLHGNVAQRSAAHPDGTREHLHLYSGRMRVGPVDDPVEIAAGDFVTYDATRDHTYQRVGRTHVQGLLVITRAPRP